MHANPYVHRPRFVQILFKPLPQMVESAYLEHLQLSSSGLPNLDGFRISRMVMRINEWNSCRGNNHQGGGSSPGIPRAEINVIRGSRSRWRNLWETRSCDRPAGTIYCLLTLSQALFDSLSGSGSARVVRMSCLVMNWRDLVLWLWR